jgi:uncharacterized membrane protein
MGKVWSLLAKHFLAPLSPVGTLFGVVAFAAALSPSLIPRMASLSGVLAGLAFSLAYAFGSGAEALWRWLGLARWPHPVSRWLAASGFAVALLIALAALVLATGWQNAVRAAVGMPGVGLIWLVSMIAISLAATVLLIMLGRLFRMVTSGIAWPLGRILPARVTVLVSIILAAWSFWAIGNGILLDGILKTLDAAYREIDALRPVDDAPPTDPLKTGSSASFVAWSGLGAEGRNRILSAPTRQEIEHLSGATAQEPLRVYVGLNSAPSASERARLALEELIRVGGFERGTLVIATPTGTGWVDPAAMMPLEILHHGDVATVSVQYSYLPSWLSLLVEPEYGTETAQAVFQAVYGHWHTLPRDHRPRLFLFGLSLGALNSDLASDAFDIVADPYDGAFWAGPPFASQTWRQMTVSRSAPSPAWLPRSRNSTIFRFMTNADTAQLEEPGWGPLRVLFLQYPSDPIVFFDRTSWRQRPAWLATPRASDVSPALAWYPGVTFLQLIADMVTATTVPKGVGHVYAADHYLDGWRALTNPAGWTESRIADVKAWLDGRGL